MEYKIIKEQVVFDDYYKILKADVCYETFSGETINAERLALHRGDSVAILLFERDTQSIILVKQFRYPITKHGKGWITELPAGTLEGKESPLNCIQREVMEEIGYSIDTAKQISEFYTSPGASTELMYLFYSEVSSFQKTGNGGGNKNENEDTKTFRLPVSEISDYLNGTAIEEVCDAKTMIALQWFLLHITP
jgi:nudix-type nucleoside diphosphatase (YffH/AdpP family)